MQQYSDEDILNDLRAPDTTDENGIGNNPPDTTASDRDYSDADILNDIQAPDDDDGVLGTTLQAARGADPLMETRRVQAARKLGTTPSLIGDVATAERDVQKREELTALDILKQAPGLGVALRDPTVARMAQGHIDSLMYMGKGLKALGGIAGAAVFRSAASVAGLMRAGADVGFSKEAGTVRNAMDSAAIAMDGKLPASPATESEGSKFAQSFAATATRYADALRPDLTGAGVVERGIVGGLESAATTALVLAATRGRGGVIGVAAPLGGITAGGAYNTAKDAGESTGTSLRYAGTQGAADALFELAPAGALLRGMTRETGLGKMIAEFTVKDVLGEQATTLVQNLDTWLTLNPTKTLDQHLAEIPDAAAETLIATLVGGGAQIGAARGIGALIQKDVPKSVEQERSDAAIKTHDALKNLSEAYANNGLKAQDPQTFRDTVSKITAEDGVADEVTIDARKFIEVLHASKVDIAQLRNDMPAVFAQLNEAIATQGELSIPVADYATYLAGTPLDESLLEHLRVPQQGDNDGMTYAQAKVYEATKGDLTAEAATLAEAAAAPVLTRAEFEAQPPTAEAVTPVPQATGDRRGQAQPDGARADRRQDAATRKRVDEMTPEEMKAALLVSDVSGLGGRRAYQEATKKPVTASIDADSLKWINDNLSPDSGDQLLKAIGDALREESADAYHISGDEFIAQGDSVEQLDELMVRVQGRLNNASITVEKPDGTTITKQGLEITYGTGSDKATADHQLKQRKVERETAGIRAGRGQEPKGVVTGATQRESDKVGKDTAEVAPATDAYEAYLDAHSNTAAVKAQRTQAVRTAIETQLKTTGRFSDVIVEAQAIPITEFYVAQAERLNITPDAFFKRYPLRITGETVSGFNQRVFHGTENAWAPEPGFPDGRPRLDRIGTGEGNKAQGWGWYSAELAEVAGIYAGDKGQILELNIPTKYENSLVLWDIKMAEQPDVVKAAFEGIDGARGRDAYKALVDKLGSDKMASEYLEGRGVVGNQYVDNSIKVGGRRPTNYVVWSQPVLDSMAKRDVFNQDDRGAFDPNTLTIGLLKGADVTTVTHESAHFYLEAIADMASQPDAPTGVVEDFKTVLDWFGIADQVTWNSMTLGQKRPHHEQWAESYERFTLEGVAPTVELQPTFSRLSAWMLKVYKSVEAFVANNPAAGKLNDEVRGVFSRLHASRLAIETTEKQRGYEALFDSAKAAGVTADEYNDYITAGQDATDQAVTAMSKRVIKDMQWLSNAQNKALKALQKTADAKRDIIHAEVTDEVMAEPINVLRTALTDKEVLLKIDTGAIKEMITGLNAHDLHGMTHAQNGTHPDQLADMFGFQSGVDMVNALLTAEKAEDKIDGITDQRMLERHGELIDPRAIQDAANAAVSTDARAKFLATGLSLLNKSAVPVNQLKKAATESARKAIDAKRIRDVKPKQYEAAETRANKEALAKLAKEPQEAIKAQRAALLNNRLGKAAQDALGEVDNGIARMARLRKTVSQGNMRGGALEQLNALMERFDLRKSRTLTAIDAEQVPLGDWLASESARLSAVIPPVPGWVLHAGTRRHYKDLTVDEFRGVMEAVKALELFARREEHQYQEIRGMKFAEERKAILDRVQSLHPEAFTVDGDPKGLLPDFVPKLIDFEKLGDKFVGEFVNAETTISMLEGGQFGQIHESLFGRLSDGVDAKATMQAGIFKDMGKRLGAYSLKERYQFSHKDIGQIGGSRVTRENVVSIALLHGSQDGRDRLSNYGWSEAKQAEVITLLEPRDLDLVEAIWGTFDNTLWPKLKELNERTRGKSPPKVKAAAYQVGERAMTGGYYRLKYDTALDERAKRFDDTAAVSEMLGGGMGMSAKTAQGTSTERKDGVTMRPRLDLGVFAETVAETVHDITMREAVADTMRLLDDKGIQNVIKTTAGVPSYNSLVTRVREVAAPPRNPAGFIENSLSIARKNTIVTLMSGLGTAVQNVTGFASSAARFKNPGLLVREIAKFSKNPKRMAEFTYAQSAYMANRYSSFDRDLQDQAKKLTVNGRILPDTATMLWFISQVDKMVSIPTWNAAFAEGMGKFENDRYKSIDYADHIVRQTQGSGRDTDVSAIMSGHGGWGQVKKVFTMFYGYFNAQLGMLVRSGAVNKQLAKTNPALATALFTKDFLLVFALPAILTTAVFSGNAPEGDEDEWLKKYMVGFLKYGLAMVPLARDVGNYAMSEVFGLGQNYGYKITPVESAVVGVVKGASAIGDIAIGEGSDKDTKDAIMGVSYAVGLPGALVSKTVMGTKAIIEGEAGPKALIYGPPPEYYKE